MTGPRTLATDYDVYEVAFLAGGPRRAVDTAVVALVESGRIRVTPLSGELSVIEHRRRHYLEAAVLDAVGRRGQWSIDTVRWRLESDERLHALAERLERDGLLSPAGSRSSIRRRHWQLLSLTGEGRRTLRHLRSDPPPDRVAGETGAMAVALAGTSRMADRDVHAALFEPPPRHARGRFGSRPRYDGPYSPTSVGWFGGDGGGFCGDGGGGGGDGGGC
jgi:hypothetical protein